jgi:hypothetical protein
MRLVIIAVGRYMDQDAYYLIQRQLDLRGSSPRAEGPRDKPGHDGRGAM